MLAWLVLLAEGDAKAEGAPLWAMGLYLLPIFAIFYFLMIRPARRQEQAQKSLLSSLKKNDKVQTIGGILGTVVSVSEKEDEVVIKVDDNARLRMIKSSIARNLTNEEAAKQAKETKPATA